MHATDPVQRLLAGLVDDAAIFPPGSMPMAEAVVAHDQHRRSRYAELVGPFLCSDKRLDELDDALGARPADAPALRVGLIVSGGLAALDDAVGQVMDDDRTTLVAVELAPVDDPAPAVSALGSLAAGVVAYLEVARAEALDALAGSGVRAKLRTGGLVAEAFPDEATVAAFIRGCLDRDLVCKCTAGLHAAVRHTTEDGLEHHGFLNILLGVHAGLEGGSAEDVAEILAERDRDAVARSAASLDAVQAERVRATFASFGTCSVTEPLEELVTLGLVAGAR